MNFELSDWNNWLVMKKKLWEYVNSYFCKPAKIQVRNIFFKILKRSFFIFLLARYIFFFITNLCSQVSLRIDKLPDSYLSLGFVPNINKYILFVCRKGVLKSSNNHVHTRGLCWSNVAYPATGQTRRLCNCHRCYYEG